MPPGIPYSSQWNLDGTGNWNYHNSNLDSQGTQTDNKSFTANAFNAYTQAGGHAMTYDLNGNLIANGLRNQSLKWDALNRPVRVISTPTTTTVSFLYDAAGRRVRQSAAAPGGTTVSDYAYDGNQIVEESAAGTGGAQKQWIYGRYIDEPLVMDVDQTNNGFCADPNDARYFYHQNLNYSVVGLTDKYGTLVEAYEYTPYGQHVTFSRGGGAVLFDGYDNMTPNGPSTVGNPYLYTGRQFDSETGMYYYRARYYDPVLGRFVSRDPIGIKGGINIYEYAMNVPIIGVDPIGLQTIYTPGNTYPEKALVEMTWSGWDPFSEFYIFHKGGYEGEQIDLVKEGWVDFKKYLNNQDVRNAMKHVEGDINGKLGRVYKYSKYNLKCCTPKSFEDSDSYYVNVGDEDIWLGDTLQGKYDVFILGKGYIYWNYKCDCVAPGQVKCKINYNHHDKFEDPMGWASKLAEKYNVNAKHNWLSNLIYNWAFNKFNGFGGDPYYMNVNWEEYYTPVIGKGWGE